MKDESLRIFRDGEATRSKGSSDELQQQVPPGIDGWSDSGVCDFLEWVEYNCVMDLQPGWIYKGKLCNQQDLIDAYRETLREKD